MTGWERRLARAHAHPDDLHTLARQCEQLAPEEQRIGFERVLRLLADAGMAPTVAGTDPAVLWAGLLADSGAYESAALAIMPIDAVYSGGRLADGTHVAQVILSSGAAADSRAAHSQAMAWLAALLRALAHAMLRPSHRPA